jgi:chitin elicitor receptor kinase 1
VRLIGYCVEGSLFLVYEHIDNGNLGQYLHGIGKISNKKNCLYFSVILQYCQTVINDDDIITGKEPLPWSSRVQIALDSARGLEYIHEHTVPVYIHRDVKSANILIDKNLRGKVAL